MSSFVAFFWLRYDSRRLCWPVSIKAGLQYRLKACRKRRPTELYVTQEQVPRGAAEPFTVQPKYPTMTTEE
jgi:hypothetical protein